jgi:hypothetical protein
MKNEVHLFQKEHDVIQPFITANKTKRKLKEKTTDAPRKMHSA